MSEKEASPEEFRKVFEEEIGVPTPEEQDRLASEQDQVSDEEIKGLIDIVGTKGTRMILEGASQDDVLRAIRTEPVPSDAAELAARINEQSGVLEPPNEVTPTPFREMTDAEIAWTDPKTPRAYKQRVRIACEDGIAENGLIEYEDGTPLTNVVRVVIVLATKCVPGSTGKVTAMVTQYHNEIGQFVYTTAEAVVGMPPKEEVDQGSSPLNLSEVVDEADPHDPGDPDDEEETRH